MSTALKDRYSKDFYDSFCQRFTEVAPSFDGAKFQRKIFTPDFESMELKERMRHTTKALHSILSVGYEEAIDLIVKFVHLMQSKNETGLELEYLFLPDYVSEYGLRFFDHSVRAMEQITAFTTCEFAVRPFMLQYQDTMTDQMVKWSSHKNHHVRRFSSEGSRLRMPWAMALPPLKNDPSPLFPILENLKNDSSEYVRRSVANNLNDIAKDHPETTLEIGKRWMGKTPETDALVKHALRTLLKAGNGEAMSLFGFDSQNIRLSDFTINTPNVQMGERLKFDFSVKNTSPKNRKIRMEYAIHHLKKNGEHTKKVFKISERPFAPNEVIQMSREHHFKPITTRVYYSGLHRVSIVLNGKEFEASSFDLSV